ncbi:hypothetical protein D3C87_2072790 [compost metagenome]
MYVFDSFNVVESPSLSWPTLAASVSATPVATLEINTGAFGSPPMSVTELALLPSGFLSYMTAPSATSPISPLRSSIAVLVA